jgi:ATP-dependent Clp protease protease subunit
MATTPNPVTPVAPQATPVAPSVPTAPEAVYAIFCGDIAQITAQKVVNGLTLAMGAKVKHVHLLFQTAGGYVGDGVFLYNLFRTVPVELTLYNAGQISSAGVIAYLGAKHRKTSRNATFMLHRSASSPQFATSTKLQHTANSLVLDDQRTEAIVRDHVHFPPKLWEQIEYHDIYVSGEEALEFGIADEIAEFAPPAGVQVFNILA